MKRRSQIVAVPSAWMDFVPDKAFSTTSSHHYGPRPAPKGLSGKPHTKRASELLYIMILNGTSVGGRKTEDLRSYPHPETQRQFGRLSFFKNATYRGSLCKLLNKGSTFVAIRPLSRWA